MPPRISASKLWRGGVESGWAMGVDGSVVGVGGEAGVHLEVPRKVCVPRQGDIENLLGVDP